RFLGRLVPHLRRQRGARARRDRGPHRREPADPARLPLQSRSLRSRRAGRAAAQEGPGQLSDPARPDGMSWVLHRIDDRLIHGQVVIAWGQHLRPRRIWIVDDAAAGNPWERDLLSEAAPGIEVRVLTVEEAALEHGRESEATGGAFLIVRDLRT